MAKPPLSPEQIQARLLYRDGLILVLDKPAGLPVHAGPGGGPNLEQCFDALRFGLPAPPALAHRLDRDTSGCLVLGRHRKALSKLGRLFQGGLVDKTYWAVVEGGPEAPGFAPPTFAGFCAAPPAVPPAFAGWFGSAGTVASSFPLPFIIITPPTTTRSAPAPIPA